jgi:hypothetical protein
MKSKWSVRQQRVVEVTISNYLKMVVMQNSQDIKNKACLCRAEERRTALDAQQAPFAITQ